MRRKTMGVALVTGASGVIGSAVARRLASDGFDVVAQHAGKGAEIDALVSEIEADGGRAIALEADIGSAFEVKALLADIEVGLGGIDVVIHFASFAADGTGPADIGLPDHAFHADIRQTAAVLSQAANRLFNGGRIVLFAGSCNDAPVAAHGRNALLAQAAQALVHLLARSADNRNITVNALAPTVTRHPPSGSRLGERRGDPGPSPFRRAERPEDIANVISFLVGPDGAWVNGQVLRGTCTTA